MLRSTMSVLPTLLLASGPLLAQAVSVAVEDASGNVSVEKRAAKKGTPVLLQLERELEEGNRIVVSGPHQITLQLGGEVPACELYLAAEAQGRFSFPVPFGKGEQGRGSAYSPDAFRGLSHTITATPLSVVARKTRRNLALNPCDQRTDTPTAFPHASTNSASRNAYNFEARNAIDGISRNGHHGEWPYQSWGPLIKDDIYWKLDFGREVELDTLRLMLRTDFPHDSYWKSAVVEFSDGTKLPLQMTDTSSFQDFHFPARKVSWFRLTQLVSAEPRWSGLMELEAWGRDLQ